MYLKIAYGFSIGQIRFVGFAFFCNFVRNTIYVLEVEMLGPLVLSRNLQRQDYKKYCPFTIFPRKPFSLTI